MRRISSLLGGDKNYDTQIDNVGGCESCWSEHDAEFCFRPRKINRTIQKTPLQDAAITQNSETERRKDQIVQQALMACLMQE